LAAASKRLEVVAMSLEEAIKTLKDAGAVFSVPEPKRKQLSLREVATQLDCSVKWVREHKGEFPRAWRMPGGELRIPQADVDALIERNKLRRLA
jgi:predicted DNA-binding transcriptional regulator AlpA